MLAKLSLEKRAIFLQRLAQQILQNPKVRLASVANLIGDPTLFDKDLSVILSILFTHDNLKSEKLSEAEQPIRLLQEIYKDLEALGFKLPQFKRRYEWVETASGKSFRNSKRQFEGGDTHALDKPLRRLREKFYELKMSSDDEHITDSLNRQVSKNTGSELTALVESLISSTKKLETEGKSYAVKEDDSRASRERNQQLDQRYDEVAALLNRTSGTSAEGPIITLYHLHGEDIDGDRWYAVKEDDVADLTRAVVSAKPNWNLESNTKWEYVSSVLSSPTSYQIRLVFPEVEDPGELQKRSREIAHIESKVGSQAQIEYKGDSVTVRSQRQDIVERIADYCEQKLQAARGKLQGARSVEQLEAETKLLDSISQPSQKGGPVVRLVRLPFSPDQIDDSFPAVEVKEDEYIGKHISKLSLEMIRKSRFSGFVDFDDNYRMMILWANAPDDNQTDPEGQSFRDHLMQILQDHKSDFAKLLGQTPEVVKTKTGAAFYYPQPTSIPRIIKNRPQLEQAISAINSDIEAMEQHTGIERSFNRTIDEDELPMNLEKAS